MQCTIFSYPLDGGKLRYDVLSVMASFSPGYEFVWILQRSMDQ